MSERISTYPYPPRPGSYLDRCVPDVGEVCMLEGEALEEVIAFENDLFAISLDPETYPRAEEYRKQQAKLGRSIQPSDVITSKKLYPRELGVHYFMTDAGRRHLETEFELPTEVNTVDSMRKYLSSLDISGTSPEALDKLQAESVKHEIGRLKRVFITHDFTGDKVPFPDIVTVYKNPRLIVEKAAQYRDLKMYVQKVKADLLQDCVGDDPTLKSKLMLVDMYRHRINEFLVETYVSAHKFLGQYYASGRSVHSDLIASLEQELPAFFEHEDMDAKAMFLQRMDRFKYGVDVDGEGDFTWQSAQAAQLVELAEQGEIEAREVDRGMYADIDPEDLRTIKVDAETVAEWLKAVLNEYDLLSSWAEWDSERKGSAEDGKWQVIVNAKFENLKIDSRQRIVQVPKKPKTLLAAITVGSHEITHVLQHENKRMLGRLAILNKDVNFEASSEQYEAGGVWQEQLAHGVLTGREDTDVKGTGYFKALETKSRGGSYGECVEAYYHDARRRNPARPVEDTADTALKSTRRIFRAGGLAFGQDNAYLTNTEPLSYLEQRFLYESLPEGQRKLLLVGGITVRNLLRLSAVGLVDISKVLIPKKAPWEIMYPFAKQAIATAKHKF